MRCSSMESSWTKIHAAVGNEEIAKSSFYSGIKVWIERPHIINRKLSAVEMLSSWVLENSSLDTVKILEDFFKKGKFTHEETLTMLESRFSQEKVVSYQKNENYEFSSVTIILRRLLPRNFEKFTGVFEVVIMDDNLNCVTFYPRRKDVLSSKIAVSFPYRFKLSQNQIVLESYSNRTEIDQVDLLSEEWLKSLVLPKILRWSCDYNKSNTVASLKLICSKSYAEKYFYLKSKYGKYFIEIWPECTDPKKYVYEDIAIAAYLMTYWENERSKLNMSSMQSFVDIGCGNGLLVHILRSEGYPGIGIDVRKRKIWDLYDCSTSLVEQSINDPSNMRFPEYDWLIGNHSDELTPWIPVIAARSSYNAKVFLLPCCSFTFNGKYERSCAKVPLYQSYLQFVSDVCKAMGFDVQQDKLRIPSTKRICFVCSSRNYKEEEEKQIDSLRIAFIESKSKKMVQKNSANNVTKCLKFISHSDVTASNPVPEFVPRNPVEAVRNCSQLDKEFLDKTVITVLNILLETKNYISIENKNSVQWNAGGEITIPDLVLSLGSEVSQKMKKQCGGLQTFLRNYKNVFHVSNGVVRLRIPSANNDWMHSKKKWKKFQVDILRTKKCYFHYHHPQGCPMSEDLCKFSHVKM
ncbi:probable tRNA (uracil-O(2)-)-methyltransferase [Uloborus diversus]|uniref:probable tRNA (uracil-O(2)-)-methyltransferase n=1 Tax=Uloborus diversus TaxID=327109 RepID=UPI00240929D9|nr:probable tRNA (uracil-O(2)-)-methyltransferase [Uloborus diversus]